MCYFLKKKTDTRDFVETLFTVISSQLYMKDTTVNSDGSANAAPAHSKIMQKSNVSNVALEEQVLGKNSSLAKRTRSRTRSRSKSRSRSRSRSSNSRRLRKRSTTSRNAVCFPICSFVIIQLLTLALFCSHFRLATAIK